MKKILLLLTSALVISAQCMYADITVKAKVPAEWTNSIYAYIYTPTSERGWFNTTQEGEWHCFTYTGSESSIGVIYVNNTAKSMPSDKNNQTANITSLSADRCIEITYTTSTTDKCTWTSVDCPSGDSEQGGSDDPETPTSYTFPAGTTIYYDLREYGAGINIYNGKWYADVSSIISVTLTADWEVTSETNLFKSAPNSWSYKTCSTLPTEGQNMIVSSDGINIHWDTYVPPTTPTVSFVSLGSTIALNQDILFSAVSNHINGAGVPATSYKYYVKKESGTYSPINDGHYQFTESGTYTLRVRAYDSLGESQAEQEKTVQVIDSCHVLYYIKSNTWSEVNAHMYGANPETVWPGAVLTLTTATTARNSYPVYSVAYTLDYTHIIFSDNGDSQTPELDINAATPYYYNSAWYAALSDCDTPELTTNFYLAGTFNNWSPSANRFVRATPDAAEASVTIDVTDISGDLAFKVVEDGGWCGATDVTLTRADNMVTIAPAGVGGNIYLTPSGTGEYVFTLNTDTRLLTVTYPEAEDEPDPSTFATVGVPAEYEGVMLQAFYWNSQSTTNSAIIYSDTRYASLLNYANQIGSHFDLVWMPPAGQGNGVGYYCKSYSNLDGASWGTKNELQQLIAILHDNNCKVIADIIINHFASSNGYANAFLANDFGSYGTFQITSQHICAGDEAFTSSESDSQALPHGADDTGSNDSGCRDLDHTNAYVQEMCKAYTQWMLNTIGFDGFRYDLTKGYHGRYLSMYNTTSEPFFSVSEYWDNKADAIQAHLLAASYNTLAFDFPLKNMFNAWAGGADYSSLVNPGLRAKGLSRHAVTFIDNHDTFNRYDYKAGEFIAYNTDLAENRSAILQANAYLLMMPGVPCVFWPHWYTFTDEINQLIALRKQIGIHSESQVTDEVSGEDYYSATIAGHHGSAILRMGSARPTAVPEGYKRAYQGEGFDIYVPGTATEYGLVEDTLPAQKVIRNGQLLIIHAEQTINAQGIRLQ